MKRGPVIAAVGAGLLVIMAGMQQRVTGQLSGILDNQCFEAVEGRWLRSQEVMSVASQMPPERAEVAQKLRDAAAQAPGELWLLSMRAGTTHVHPMQLYEVPRGSNLKGLALWDTGKTGPYGALSLAPQGVDTYRFKTRCGQVSGDLQTSGLNVVSDTRVLDKNAMTPSSRPYTPTRAATSPSPAPAPATTSP